MEVTVDNVRQHLMPDYRNCNHYVYIISELQEMPEMWHKQTDSSLSGIVFLPSHEEGFSSSQEYLQEEIVKEFKADTSKPFKQGLSQEVYNLKIEGSMRKKLILIVFSIKGETERNLHWLSRFCY